MTERHLAFVRSTRVVLPHGVSPATVHIEDGRIARVGRYDDNLQGEGIDAGALACSPALYLLWRELKNPV